MPAVYEWVLRPVMALEAGDIVRVRGVERQVLEVNTAPRDPKSIGFVEMILEDGDAVSRSRAMRIERWERIDAGGAS